MLFLNILDLVDHKRSRAKSEEHETFLPTTVTRFEIPETKPGYPWMEVSSLEKKNLFIIF